MNQLATIGNKLGGRYEVLKILGGRGVSAFGIVYVCYDHRSGSVFALKTLQNQWLSIKDLEDLFKREALTWINLGSHPNIVSAIGLEDIEKRIYIVLEFIRWDDLGRNSLSHYINDLKSTEQILRWSIHICCGMEYIFSKGVQCHGDLKPDNIMVSPDEGLKITDFGLSKLRQIISFRKGLKQYKDSPNARYQFLNDMDESFIIGAPPWMAPERFMGTYDIRSDVYSFGIMLYQMANRGLLPFAGSDYKEYYKLHKTAPIPSFNSSLSPIVSRCIKKDPTARYISFSELRKDLEDLYLNKFGKSIDLPVVNRSEEPWQHLDRGKSFYILGLLPYAIKELRNAIRLDPGLAEAHYDLGRIMYSQNQFEAAISEFKVTITLEPKHSHAIYGLGLAYEAMGDVDKAMIIFSELLELDPDYIEAYRSIGDCYGHKKLWEKAIESYHTYLNKNPQSIQGINNIGAVYQQLGQHENAIKYFTEALEIDSGSGKIHFNLAISLDTKGNYNEALLHYKRALELNEQKALVHMRIGKIYSGKGLYEDAVVEFKIAIKEDQSLHEAYNALGVAYDRMELIDEAIGAYKAAIQLMPYDAIYYFNIGYVYQKKSLASQAIHSYRRSLEIDPNYYPCSFNLACLLMEIGDQEEASRAFHKFLDCVPPDQTNEITYAREQLKKLNLS